MSSLNYLIETSADACVPKTMEKENAALVFSRTFQITMSKFEKKCGWFAGDVMTHFSYCRKGKQGFRGLGY